MFPKPVGNLKRVNQYGQDILDDILTHPNSKMNRFTHRNFGKIIDVEIPGQGGARFYENGNFIGLLEPLP